jgi:hypothetical protein
MVNPPGTDNPDDEYVCIVNLEGRRVGMNGWELSDAGHKHTYTFSNFGLEPQQYVRLHSGAGADSQNDLYWRQEDTVWGNKGDAVLLVDDGGHRIDMRSYSEREDGAIAGDCGASVASTPPPTRVPVDTPTPMPTPPDGDPCGPCAATDCNCGDFPTWQQAKACLDAYPSDPFDLDSNHDGVPCESLPGAP